MEHHLVVRLVAQLLIPVILLFALYVQFHGDYGPGGGFQAGVIFAAALCLYGLVFGLQTLKKVISQRVINVLSAAGVVVYASAGVASMLLGGEFLNYDVLGADPQHGQHYGILWVELGVGITVTAVITNLFYCFVGYGSREEEESIEHSQDDSGVNGR